MGKRITLTLPMEPDFELVATETASALAELNGLEADQIDEIRIALIEACINAFEHSNAPDGKVDVTLEAEQDRLVIVVEDHGRGFCCDPAGEKPRSTRSGRKRGFGLRIIKEMMDEVRVESSDGGTRIVMIKKKGQ